METKQKTVFFPTCFLEREYPVDILWIKKCEKILLTGLRHFRKVHSGRCDLRDLEHRKKGNGRA